MKLEISLFRFDKNSIFTILYKTFFLKVENERICLDV